MPLMSLVVKLPCMAAREEQITRYPVPDASISEPHVTQTEARKSRFLAQTCRVDSRSRSLEFLGTVRGLHPDATHNCWAYLAGSPGDAALVGSSDDGEPHGSAGRPMLNVLLHCGIGQICVIVSRWFGGIKLGTGGLARAYQEAVSENLKSLPLANAVPRRRWLLKAEYSWIPAIRRVLPEFEAIIEGQKFGTEAELILSAPLDKSDSLRLALANLSAGRARLVKAAP